MRTRGPSWTPISAAVLALLLVGGCARKSTPAAAGSPYSPPASSSPPVVSSLAASAPATSAPAASTAPDPCLAPVVEQQGSLPVSDPDAISLRVCHPGAVRGRAGSVVLSQNDANNIGKLLDLAPAGADTCAYKPDVLLRFQYSDAPEEDVQVASVGCDQPTATVGGRSWLIPQTLADYLSSDSIAPGLPGNPVPDVTGLSLTDATVIITKAGLTIVSGERVTDPLLSANTVVLQDPPAGTGVIGGEVDVLLSQQPAPACLVTQLAADYHGVQYGTGDAFADLDVRDTSATACTLTGPISVVGLNAAGHAVTNQLTFTVARDLILSADTPPRAVDAGAPQNEVIAWVLLEADVRDGPDAGGSCVDHLVVPRAWLLKVGGGEKRVPNGVSTSQPPMGACEGKLAVPINPPPITALS